MDIKSYCDEQNITFSELAERVGVTRQAMGRYARGKRIPRPPVMARIIKITDGKVGAADFYV